MPFHSVPGSKKLAVPASYRDDEDEDEEQYERDSEEHDHQDVSEGEDIHGISAKEKSENPSNLTPLQKRRRVTRACDECMLRYCQVIRFTLLTLTFRPTKED